MQIDLYLIIDICSRYTPGWVIAASEDGELPRRFLREAIIKQGIDPDTLTLRADRSTSIKREAVADMLPDLSDQVALTAENLQRQSLASRSSTS